MKKKWEPVAVKATPKAINQDKYDQRIAEVAEVLYDLFCQLERSNQAKPIESGASPGDFTLHEERTGTHG